MSTATAPATLAELNEQFDAKNAELSELAKKSEPTDADIKLAEQIDAEIGELTTAIKSAADRANAMKGFGHKAKTYQSLATDPAGGVPFRSRIEVTQDEDDKTKSLADFLQCVGVTGVTNDPRRNHAFERLEKVYNSQPKADFRERYAKSQEAMGLMSYKAALAEASGITAGYTVPTQFGTDLLMVEPEEAVIVGRTDDYPMVGRELKMPALDQTTVPTAGTSPYFGGVVANWTAEAATRTETEPKFKEFTLVANELSGYALASRNVLADNVVALERRLSQLFREALTWYRDYAYLQGNGIGQPLGILNSPATISQNRATANQFNYADAAKMLGQLLPRSTSRAYWVISQSVLQNLLQMADGSSRLIFQPYYPSATGGPATAPPAPTILGLRYIVTEKLPALGTKGDVMLVDPKYYFSASRQDIEIAASEHYKFLNNQITYRFLYRGDGRPWLDSYITLQDATTKISPFVVLN